MALRRYEISDSYTLEEFRHLYDACSVAERIRLLRHLHRTNNWNWDIVELAAMDLHPVVRQWIARNGPLTDGDECLDTLRNDDSEFVRAATLENSGFVPANGDFEYIFSAATKLERLALMRNPSVTNRLVQKIFDPSDSTLGIDLQERVALISAYLSNGRALKGPNRNTRQNSLDSVHVGVAHDFATHEHEQHCAYLWRMAVKWNQLPQSVAVVSSLVHMHVETTDAVKAEIYPTYADYPMRLGILTACTSEDRRTLALGLQDSDEFCKALAASKRPLPNSIVYDWPSHLRESRFPFLGAIQFLALWALFSIVHSPGEKLLVALSALTWLAIALTSALQRTFATKRDRANYERMSKLGRFSSNARVAEQVRKELRVLNDVQGKAKADLRLVAGIVGITIVFIFTKLFLT